jgi:hypothetical protein
MGGFWLWPPLCFCSGRTKKLCDTVGRLRNISNISESGWSIDDFGYLKTFHRQTLRGSHDF